MLSVAKTKNIIDVERFAEGREVVVSWKLDGLTLVLRYDKGKFVQAITRGSDGIVGEDVTKAVQYMRGVPQKVICRDAFEVRGEGLISWADMAYLDKNNTDSTHPRNPVWANIWSQLYEQRMQRQTVCQKSRTADTGRGCSRACIRKLSWKHSACCL